MMGDSYKTRAVTLKVGYEQRDNGFLSQQKTTLKRRLNGKRRRIKMGRLSNLFANACKTCVYAPSSLSAASNAS